MSGGSQLPTTPVTGSVNSAPKYLWSTTDGRAFDGPTALASYIGVSTGAVCNAAREAQQRESDIFSCGGQSCSRRQLVTELPQDMESTQSVSGGCGVQYILALMPVMQAHAHLQAAAHRLYPGRKLKIPTMSVHQIQSIRTWTPRTDGANNLKFDLAQLWSLHSPSSYTTKYGFRRALLGEPQEKPVPELRKYSSLSFFIHEHLSKPSVAMSAEDIIRFMLSEFARKGQFDEIFETPPCQDLLPAQNTSDAILENQLVQRTDAENATPAPQTQGPQHAPNTPPPSPRRAFAQASETRMREVEQHIRAGADLELVDQFPAAARSKRRKLALTAACGITRVLFDANKLLLDAMLKD